MGDHADPNADRLDASTDRWRWAGLILMGLFFLAFPLFRFYEPAQRADARARQTEFFAAQGAELFEGSCASCHGPGGSGAIAPALGAKEFLESVDDVQIAQLIAHGVPGSEMVAYSNDFGGPLTSSQITAVTTYLRSLEGDAESNPNWVTPLADENLTGHEIYILACSRCHGIDLEGRPDIAPDIGPGSDAAEDSDARVAKRIREGNKTMPRFGRILTDYQIDLIVAYLREVQEGG
ncbi:MAG: c-type cytochrome [Acidobacteria bacterium]|nr:c-type cytochrome [Acidobacteriota bacterium]